MAHRAEYVLTRDYLDDNRINLQHYLWVELFGYHLHPNIPKDGSHLRIADVGTGTGIWLTDLSRKLPPTVQLDALDISFQAIPPREWMPKNISFREWDVTKNIPEDLAGVYDVVHIRNFGFVLQDDQISGVLANLKRLLKPGGYLQWADPDIISFRIEKTKPENKSDALIALLKLSQGQDRRLRPTWIARLSELFADANFTEIVEDVRDAPPAMAFAKHECNLIIHELLARSTHQQDVLDRVTRIMPEVAKETREGSMWAFTRYVVVGRKPL